LLPWTLLFALALAAGGCAHPKPAEQIANDGGLFNKFKAADKTSVVGRVDYVDPDAADDAAIVQLSRAPFAMGTFLVVRDTSMAPTAVIETTKQSSHNFQAVVIVSGKVLADEEVVEPGPELARLVQENIDSYLVSHPAPAPAKAMDISAPATPEQAQAAQPADTSSPITVPGPAVEAPTPAPAAAPAADTTTSTTSPAPAADTTSAK
jgi:hypothetical protein